MGFHRCVSWVLAAAALFLAFSPRVLPEDIKWSGVKKNFTEVCQDPLDTINAIVSIRKGSEKDRLFGVGCTKIPIWFHHESPKCAWMSGKESLKGGYEQGTFFNCDDNGYINGIRSKYDGGKGDRIFEHRCCRIENTNNSWCHQMEYLEDVEDVSVYVVDNNLVLKGMGSKYDPIKKDRQFKFKRCSLHYKSS